MGSEIKFGFETDLLLSVARGFGGFFLPASALNNVAQRHAMIQQLRLLWRLDQRPAQALAHGRMALTTAEEPPASSTDCVVIGAGGQT